MNGRGHFVGGAWTEGTGEVFESRDPFSDDVLWRGREGTADDVARAVEAARRARESWAGASLAFRTERLQAFGREVRRSRDSFATVISRETGKPLWESLSEVDAVVAKVGLSVEAFDERCAVQRLDIAGGVGEVRYRPLGVVAVLGPFNLPAHLPNGHVVPALLAGNTVVLKSSELAPTVGQRMAELWEDSGLPPGVLNLIQGGAPVGRALAEDPGIDGLFFTGSYATGRALHRALAGRPEVLVALEMGGNNPLIVWDVADLDAAALQTVQSAHITAGQRCSCARRLILPTGLAGDAFLERLFAWIARLRVGGFTDRPEPFLGPVISSHAAKRLLAAQADLVARGGRVLVEMTRVGGRDALLSPGLIDVTGMSELPDEEHFGPLLQVIRVDDFEAALEESNRTAYGLSAGLLTDDRELYLKFAKTVRAGVLHWNRSTTGASGRLPFGGLGHSGNHRAGGYRTVEYCSDPVALLEGGALGTPAALPTGIG